MSSAGYLGKTTNDWQDTMGSSQDEDRLSQWGTIPGKIKSFDPETQTATIQPLYKPKHDGKAIDMPELLEVPVRFPRAGGGGLTHPVKEGDYVELRPGMRDGEKYHTDGDGEAQDSRSFSLADMEAYVIGGEPNKEPMKNFDGDNHHMRFDEDGNYGIKGSPGGKFAMLGSEGNAYTLLCDVAKKAGDGFTLLGTEPGLVHASEYAQLGQELLEIESKLRGMAL